LSNAPFTSIAPQLLRRPIGLNELSTRVFDVLAASTAFPWPILETQAKRAKRDPLNLTRDDLEELLLKLIEALGRYTSPEKTSLASEALRRLITG